MQHNKEDLHNVNDFDLATLSNLFEQQPPVSPRTMAITGHMHAGPSNHSHHSSLSSESGSSLVERTQTLSRTHPSLQGYPRTGTRRSPDSHESPAAQRRELYGGLPATRKRMQHGESDDEEDSEELEPLDPNATEEEKKAYKRRQNTLAARRSRAKRQNEFKKLQDENNKLNRETAMWKERALMMERLLTSHGLPCPNFSR